MKKQLCAYLILIGLTVSIAAQEAMHWDILNDVTGKLAYLVRGQETLSGTTARIGDDLRIQVDGGHGRIYELTIIPVGKDSCKIQSETQEFVDGDHNTTKETPNRANLALYKKWKHLLRFPGRYEAKYQQLAKCVP